jgi:hypothetical protein
MSVAHGRNAARLEQLYGRFEDAAYRFPLVDAVVVHLPDLRFEETARQARMGLDRVEESKRLEPSVQFTPESGESEKWAIEPGSFAMKVGNWIPPYHKSIEELGCQVYGNNVIHESVTSELGRRVSRELWRCTLFGPPAADSENTGLRLFNLLATDAVPLILRGADGCSAPRAHWLVHLANRDEPLEPISRRRHLDLSQWPESPPCWRGVTLREAPTLWWAVRLNNVFHHSRDAVAKVMNSMVRARASPVLTPAESVAPVEWTRDGPLELMLDTNTHTVRRRNQGAEFDASGRAWEVFLKLTERYPARYLVTDLGHDVWNPNGADIDPDPNVVQQTITAIRRLLRPLGIDVKHTRKLGYILSELPVANPRPNIAKRRSPTTPRARKR